jgi:GDSL-like lipase/acylhydrolase family protein
MTRNRFLSAGAVALVLLVAACEPDSARITGPKGQEAFNKYVSLGTSVSMGYQSAGVYYSTQQSAWPALLAHQAFATSFTTPEIQGPGCYSPLIAPLSLGFRRLSGGTIQSPAASDLVCALVAGITLPTNNVAVDGATTYAALRITPESVTVAPTTVEPDQRKRLYRAVLAPGKSQVTSMMAQNPTLVSVELGANEALRSVTDGFVIPATRYRQADGTFSYYPFNIWQPQYDAIVDSIARTGAKALLVSVPLIPNIVGVYPGNDFYKDSVTFASFGINVSIDCNGNTNSIFAFTKVLIALGSPKPNTFSCTDNANPAVGDFILTPADVTFINAVITQMNNYIQSTASGHGWAYLELNTALASFIAIKQSFSLNRFLSCTRPFGQYIGLDGVHPTLDGQQAIANAAADALNATYGFEIPKNERPVLTAAQMCSQ